MEKATKLTTVSNIYSAFKNTSRTTTFNRIARETLTEDFSARGIFKTHKVDFYKFMECLVDEKSELNAVTLYGNEKVYKFINACENEMSKDVRLNEEYMKISGEKGVETTKDEEYEVKDTKVATSEAKTADTTGVEVDKEAKSVSASMNFNVDLGGILGAAAKEYLESDAAGILSHVNKRITEEAQKLKPTQVAIGERPVVTMKGRLHKQFKLSLMLTNLEKQLYISGPAGTGKTTLASQIAESFSQRFGHISCTAGMSEAHLLGRMVADGSYVSSQFVDFYENGGVYLFDEIDAADANTLLVVNSALANGHMSVPNRQDKPIANRHPEFYAICAANTWGNGSNEYAGRSVLDDAFLDRFAGCKVEVDYDQELEKEILTNNSDMATKLWRIRENVKTSRIRRVVSTRAFVSASRQLSAGCTQTDFLNVFFTGWTKEEREKAEK